MIFQIEIYNESSRIFIFKTREMCEGMCSTILATKPMCKLFRETFDAGCLFTSLQQASKSIF